MNLIKMEALRTFAGTEGFFRKGDLFETTEYRASALEDRGYAKRVETELIPNEEPEPIARPPSPKGEVRLIEPVEGPIIVKPPFYEAVTHIGGGWYELPNGKRIQGKESAQAEYERSDNNG